MTHLETINHNNPTGKKLVVRDGTLRQRYRNNPEPYSPGWDNNLGDTSLHQSRSTLYVPGKITKRELVRRRISGSGPVRYSNPLRYPRLVQRVSLFDFPRPSSP